MLTTLIYQSQLNAEFSDIDLVSLTNAACIRNKAIQVTGILLFNGNDFFQVLEGDESAIDALFSHISDDPRHSAIVELLRDYSAYRRFSDIGMTFFDLQIADKNTLIDQINHLNQVPNRYLPDDKVSRLIKRFIECGAWYRSSLELKHAQWKMVSKKEPRQNTLLNTDHSAIYTFAMQPIVDVSCGRITSFEALIRDRAGRSPEAIFASVPPDLLYAFDLQTKGIALELAGKILHEDEKIAINLLPGSLYTNPDSVNQLIKQISQANLRPEQVIIELIETEVIINVEIFHNKLKDVRAAGIGLAIDDFGSGYSRLSFLSKIQPDEIKIDRSLIQDIHRMGGQQSVVVAIVRYCEDMGINLVAEGVEKLEEWCWLESVGVKLYQGFLFSRPCLNGVGEMHWPVKIS